MLYYTSILLATYMHVDMLHILEYIKCINMEVYSGNIYLTRPISFGIEKTKIFLLCVIKSETDLKTFL